MADTVPAEGLMLAWPWLLAALPLPWLVRRWLSAARGAGMQALKVPWFTQLTTSAGGWLRKPLLVVVATLVWALLVAAAARPQWVGEILTLPVTGRDLLAVVLSHQGRYREAEPLFLETMETQRRALGDDHPNTLGSGNNLAGRGNHRFRLSVLVALALFAEAHLR